MARRKNAEGVEVEVADEVEATTVIVTTVGDAPEAAPELSEQTKAEMAEGRRILAERQAELAAFAERSAAAEADKPAE